MGDPMTIEQIAQVAKALSDPIRLRMLSTLAQGRSCCGLPEPSGAGMGKDADGEQGVCVCEFQEQFGFSQSRVSYHLQVLRNAGLIDVHERGKWSFYSIRKAGVEELLEQLGGWIS
jgi:ArsR family transcriptional regulator, arsenate/arsenite/antimonite-responsive transcriptional repressor